MTAPPLAADGLVISAWSAISPFGIGAERFAEGVRAGRSAVSRLDPATWRGPFGEAGLIPEFDVAGVLGTKGTGKEARNGARNGTRKGTRSMDRATGVAVATVGLLLDPYEHGLGVDHEDIGLVLGTSGSVQSMMDFTHDSLTGERPYHVDPARFPNTVLNCAAARCAIWYGIKGPNTSLASGAVSGLSALSYGARLGRCGHCEMVLCGAVEEFSPQRSRLDWHARTDDERADPPGEGCAFFLLEPHAVARRHGREPLAEVLAARFGGYGVQATAREVLSYCISSVLRRTGLVPDDVMLVAPSGAEGRPGGQESAAIAESLGESRPAWVNVRDLLGDTAAASAAFQLAAVLVASADVPRGGGGAALITSVDRDGIVGAMLVRIL